MGDALYRKQVIQFVWRLPKKNNALCTELTILKRLLRYRELAAWQIQLDKPNLTIHVPPPPTLLPPPLIWREQPVKLLSSLRCCWFLALFNNRFGLLSSLCCIYAVHTQQFSTTFCDSTTPCNSTTFRDSTTFYDFTTSCNSTTFHSRVTFRVLTSLLSVPIVI